MTRVNKIGRRAAVGISAVVVALALAAAVASGASHGSHKTQHRQLAVSRIGRARVSAALSPSLASAIGAFQETSPLSVEDAASLASVERIVSASSDSSLPASGADLALARPAPIGGSDETAWIAPAGDKVCAFAPLGTEAYGAGCSTLAEVLAGNAVHIAALPSGDSHESVRVVVVVADGQAAPIVTDAEGNTSALPVVANLAAALLPGTDSIRTAGGRTIDLSSFTAKLGS
jgi:hypothetical protein